MAQLDSMVGQHLADEQPAMAVSWLGLAAHQRHAVPLATAYEALNG
jgi:hypothetical protein